MHRLARLFGQHGSLLARASILLLACGVALSAWALLNIVTESRSAAPVSSQLPAPIKSASVPATVSITASSAAGATQTVHPAKPKKGEVFGKLSIPRLGQTFSILQGTSAEELRRGVGHMVRTAMPGESDNCVVSGHRDTVFSRLGKVKKGDRLIVETDAGKFTYQVKRIRIVHKDDRTVVVRTDRAVLTVSTCYPFRYIGSAPDRYAVIAELVAKE